MKKINWNQSENLSMLTDFYELTMGNGYFENGIGTELLTLTCFSEEFRKNGGFAIMAGLAQVIEYINNLKFEDDDIEFLRSKGIFSEDFLKYLKDFKFCCDIWAIPEGTPIFSQ